MKRVSILVGVVLLLATIAPALADSRGYNAGVTESGNIGSVYNRYYNPDSDKISPVGSTGCSSSVSRVGWSTTLSACELKYFTPTAGNTTPGYNGYNEDIANDNGIPGDRCVVLDNEQNAGAANHTGFYFFDCKPVLTTSTSRWNAADCSGTDPRGCAGHGDVSTSNNKSIANTPLGTISPKGGFRPIPVPLVNSVNKATGAIALSWSSAGGFASSRAVSYDLYTTSNANCSPPLAGAFTFLRNETGLATTVTVDPATQVCHYFAIKLRYPDAGGVAVRSLFLSANSQGANFTSTAGTVEGITAKAIGGQGIAVSWRTSLEDGLKGFYVSRSFTQGGTFERVSGLVPAKGEPSSYTYMDTTVPAGTVRATGVYYKVETVDIDDATQAYGPVKADLSGVGRSTVAPQEQLRKKAPRK